MFASTFNLWEGNKYKHNVFEYKRDRDNYHPTQKPVLLLEDLIKTFSNENDFVVDFTMGSGSTGVAAKNLNRAFIGIEKDENYFNIAKERIYNTQKEIVIMAKSQIFQGAEDEVKALTLALNEAGKSADTLANTAR